MTAAILGDSIPGKSLQSILFSQNNISIMVVQNCVENSIGMVCGTYKILLLFDVVDS